MRPFTKGEATFITPAAAILAEGLGTMLDAARAENYVQFDMLPRLDRGTRPIRPQQAKNDLLLIPLHPPRITAGGIQYYEPLKPHALGCNYCPVREICYQVVSQRDGLALCEQLLPEEIIPLEAQAVVAFNLQQRYEVTL